LPRHSGVVSAFSSTSGLCSTAKSVACHLTLPPGDRSILPWAFDFSFVYGISAPRHRSAWRLPSWFQSRGIDPAPAQSCTVNEASGPKAPDPAGKRTKTVSRPKSARHAHFPCASYPDPTRRSFKESQQSLLSRPLSPKGKWLCQVLPPPRRHRSVGPQVRFPQLVLAPTSLPFPLARVRVARGCRSSASLHRM